MTEEQPPPRTDAAHASERALGAFPDARALWGLRHEDAERRLQTVEQLGASGDARLLGHLVPLLLDPAIEVREAVVRAIAGLDDPRRTRALGRALADEAESVRERARDALTAAGLSVVEAERAARAPCPPYDDAERLDPGRDIASLATALRDPRWTLRQTAASRLRGIDDPGAQELLLFAVADPHRYVRGEAVEALARRGDPAAGEALVHALHDHAGTVRREALDAARRIRAVEAVPFLRARLQSVTRDGDAEEWSESELCDALLEIGGAESLESIRAGLANPDARVRSHICFVMSKRADPADALALAGALDDPSEDVRAVALDALGKLGSGGPVELLTEMYRSGSDHDRAAAASALCAIGGAAGERAMIASLRDRKDYVRAGAAAAIVRNGTPRAWRALFAAVRRGHPEVALEAWRRLVEVGDPATLPTLEEALEIPDFGRARKMAAGFVVCGNPRLARAATRQFEDLGNHRGPPIRWGVGPETKP